MTTLPGDTVTQTDKTDKDIKQSLVQIFQYMQNCSFNEYIYEELQLLQWLEQWCVCDLEILQKLCLANKADRLEKNCTPHK